MKQDFPLFDSWIGRAFVLSILLLTSLVAGCHDPFDDTEINNRLDELESRIEKLEADYQTQMNALQVIASLQEAIDALQSSTSVNAEDIAALAKSLGTAESEIEKALKDLQEGVATVEETLSKLGFTISAYRYHDSTGKYEIVLSNGTVIELMAKDTAVDAVKVMTDSDGKLYWSVNGEFLKDSDGNKIPVYVTPEVRINTSTKEIEVSVNGGAYWHPTGLFMEDEVPALFSSVTSDEYNVYFTLADGTTLTVALSQPEMNVVIPVMKIHVMPGETRQVKIRMQNVDKYIIVKPEGWHATISGEILSITAPEEGVGESSGHVQIFVVSKDGKSAIHELKVQSGAPDLEIPVNKGIASITVNERAASDESWQGYIYGVKALGPDCTLEDVYELEAGMFDPRASQVVKESISGIDMTEYVGPLQQGVEYVVWAIGIDRVKDEYDEWTSVPQAFEDMHYETYTNVYVSIEVTNQTVRDADVMIAAFGMEKAYFGLYSFASAEGAEQEALIAETKEEFLEHLKWNATWGDYDLPDNRFEGKLSELNSKFNWNTGLIPGHTYMIMAVPADNMSVDEIEYRLVEMKDIELGQTDAFVTISNVKAEQTEVSATITPSEGSEFRYLYMTAEEYMECTTDELKKEKIMRDTQTSYAEGCKAARSGLNPDTDLYLVILVYDVDYVGRIISQSIATEGLNFSNETVSYKVISTRVNSADIEVAVSGGVVSLRYYFSPVSNYAEGGFPAFRLEDADMVMALGELYGIKTIETLNSDGRYTIDGMEAMEDQYLFVTGIDASGKATKTAYMEVSTKSAFKAGWTPEPAVLPVINDVLYVTDYVADNPGAVWNRMSELKSPASLNGSMGAFKLDVNWNGIDVRNVWLIIGNPGFSGSAFEDTQTIIRLRSSEYSTPDYKLQTSDYGSLRAMDDSFGESLPQTIYMAYEDMDGRFYPYIEIIPEDFCPVLSNTIEGKQWTWRDSDMGCRRVFDLSATTSGIIYFADFYDDTVKENGKLPVNEETGEPYYNVDMIGKWVWSEYYENYEVTKIDETSGIITFSATMTNIYGTNTTYFRVDYSGLTETSVNLYSPMSYKDSEGNYLPVLDENGNSVIDLVGYPQYWWGMGFGSEDSDGNPLPITLTLSTKELEVVMLEQ